MPKRPIMLEDEKSVANKLIVLEYMIYYRYQSFRTVLIPTPLISNYCIHFVFLYFLDGKNELHILVYFSNAAVGKMLNAICTAIITFGNELQ